MKCFNPDCLHQNPTNNNFCQKCGQKLLLMERYQRKVFTSNIKFFRS